MVRGRQRGTGRERRWPTVAPPDCATRTLSPAATGAAHQPRTVVDLNAVLVGTGWAPLPVPGGAAGTGQPPSLIHATGLQSSVHPLPALAPGYLYEAGIGWATLTHPNGWRWMIAALVLPPALLTLALLFVLESPFWLVMRGRHAEVGRMGCFAARGMHGMALPCAGRGGQLQYLPELCRCFRCSSLASPRPLPLAPAWLPAGRGRGRPNRAVQPLAWAGAAVPEIWGGQPIERRGRCAPGGRRLIQRQRRQHTTGRQGVRCRT